MKNPTQLPGCTNKSLLVWGRSLVNWSIWSNAVNTQGGSKHVILHKSSIVPVSNFIHTLLYQTETSDLVI